MARTVMLAILAGLSWQLAVARVDELAERTAEAIRSAATAAGTALPLASGWYSGTAESGFGPAFQLDAIEHGHQLLPWFWLPRPDNDDTGPFDRAAFRRAAALRLPISFVSTQWEVLVAESVDRPLHADTERSAAGVSKLSPYGPIRDWYEAGRRWGSHPLLRELQALYPAPPRVLFVSNNEQPRTGWQELRGSTEIERRLGPRASDEAIRRDVGDAWIARYRELQRGFADALTSQAWRRAATFVGYDAFGTGALGRWPGWMEYSLLVPGRLEPWPLAWDGASPSYYTYDWNATTDFNVMSPQIEAMNWLPMQAEARRLNPGFWFELSVWDGQQPGRPSDKAAFYRRLGQSYGPRRYQGFLTFGLWLLRPRLLREFRDPQATRADFGAYFDALVAAVDRVHADPDLRRFWQAGRLLPNRRQSHPYGSSIPAGLRATDRWFLLDSSANPAPPWSLDTRLRVFALALQAGTAPRREWLIYAFSPLDEEITSTLRVPDGPELEVRATTRGCYSRVAEADLRVSTLRC